jgi:hypothetical protein
MTLLPPDPEYMNDARADWAATAIHCFAQKTGTDDEDVLADLLCDLMHWSDRHGGDFENALRLARLHYDAETAPGPTEDDDQAVVETQASVSPVDAAKSLGPYRMQNVREFDALIQPSTVVGFCNMDTGITEPCEPQGEHFWTAYGHYGTGAVRAFEDFRTEAEARAFRNCLIGRLSAFWPEGSADIRPFTAT